MLSWIREKFGTIVISGIIGFIGFVFVFYGVFSPKSTRGIHEAAVAGTVNGEPITHREFGEEVRRRMEFFKSLGGGQLTDQQMKQFRIKEGVFQELVRRKLMVQEAQKQGLVPSDEEIKDKITEMPYFQKDGKFDKEAYRQILAGNGYTPASFERRVREDLTAQQWEGFFRNRVQISSEEIKRQFLIAGDRREVKYVVLDVDQGKKTVAATISAAEIEKFLKDSGKLNVAQAQYDREKETQYKGKTFDAVKAEIARDLLASDKVAEVQKANLDLANKIQPLLTLDQSSEAKINALLKPVGTALKTTPSFSRMDQRLPGVGDPKDLVMDAFAKKSPIDPAQGGKAKIYTRGAWVMIALVSKVEKPDLQKLDTEREMLTRQLQTRKERELYDQWMKKLTDKAKIDTNPSIVGYADDAAS